MEQYFKIMSTSNKECGAEANLTSLHLASTQFMPLSSGYLSSVMHLRRPKRSNNELFQTQSMIARFMKISMNALPLTMA